MATVSVEAHWRVYSPRSSYLDRYRKTHIVTGVRITAAIRTYRLVICYKSAEHSRADKTDADYSATWVCVQQPTSDSAFVMH
jgi:hypothetical protein